MVSITRTAGALVVSEAGRKPAMHDTIVRHCSGEPGGLHGDSSVSGAPFNVVDVRCASRDSCAALAAAWTLATVAVAASSRVA